ncbi:MAG: hypothetical protein V4539_00905 [Bacteroidota bacterium]
MKYLKFLACLVAVTLLAETPPGCCQSDYKPTVHQYQNFTPINEPNAIIEKITVIGAEGVFLLINNNGVQSIALYAAEPVFEWYTIPLPSEKTKVVDIAATIYGGLFALQYDAAGQPSISYFYGTKWSKISIGKLNGVITKIFCFTDAYLYAAGNFTEDGHPYRLAIYDYSKKWKPALAPNDEMFDNTTVKKMSVGHWRESLLLQNNSTGKFSVVLYDDVNHKWETLQTVPNQVADMAITTNNTLYICGSDDGSGKPYLQRWVKGAWEKIDIGANGFTQPEMIVAYSDEIWVAGPAKNAPFYSIEHWWDNKWYKGSIAPANLKKFGRTTVNTYLVAEENGRNVFYRSLSEAAQSPPTLPSLQGPPPGSLSDLAAIVRKKNAKEEYDKRMADIRKVYTSVPELIDAFVKAREKYKNMRVMSFGALNMGSMKEIDDVINQANDVLATLLYYYEGKLKAMTVKDEESGLAIAFQYYLTVHITQIKDIGDGMSSIKGTLTSLAKESKPSSAANNSFGYLSKQINVDKANLINAATGVTTAWNLYRQKMNLPTEKAPLL